MPPARRPDDRPWYAEGLAFECTLCGGCCSGPPGVVRFTDEEGAAIARRLGLSQREFLDRCTHAGGLQGERSLNEVETEFGFDCVFLDRTSVPGKAVCGIYEDRPLQCRTFPWWPEHVASPRSWQRLGKSCEGVGRGPVVAYHQIRVQLERQSRGDGPVPG